MDFVFLLLGIICLHKNKQAWSFTIFIGLLTSYYQMGSNLSDFIVPHNVSDTGLLLMLYMLFYGYSRKVIYSYPVLKQLFWSIFCFSVFLTIAVLYDYAGGMDAISIIQSTRHWLLLLLAVPLLRYYPVGAFEKTIRYMLYVSLFATVLILLDHYAGTRLLDHGEVSLFLTEDSYFSVELSPLLTAYSISFCCLPDILKTSGKVGVTCS